MGPMVRAFIGQVLVVPSRRTARRGVGTPRGLQGCLVGAIAAFSALLDSIYDLIVVPGYPQPDDQPPVLTNPLIRISTP